MKQIIIFICQMLLLSSCNNHKAFAPNFTVVSKQRYEEDKKQIVNCFMKNVEAYKILKKKGEYLYDPATYYNPYSTSIYDELARVNRISSIPISKTLKIRVDTILYDSLGHRCFAFVGIKRITLIYRGTIYKEQDTDYDAKAFIGIRKNINDSLSIYPCELFGVSGFESYDAALNRLKHYFYNSLKGSSLNFGVYLGKLFEENVGDKEFFKNSLFFQKYTKDSYNCEYYFDLGKNYKYKYPYMK
jgi:hypothetical protein